MHAVDESMRGVSSLGAAAVEDVSVNLTNDTLIEAMFVFHNNNQIVDVTLLATLVDLGCLHLSGNLHTKEIMELSNGLVFKSLRMDDMR